jgi:serine phosphatase RsbU (regulator of sigma subunit)
MIRLRKIISREFIGFILHYQALFCLVVAAYMSYALGDQRHIAPIGCLLVLIFVFVQSAFAVSFIYIVMEVVLYISASYVGIRVYNQAGSLLSEVLYIVIYVPVCLFMAYIARVMQEQQKKIKHASSKLKSAHSELERTYDTLETVHEELESQNERMVESIRYAEMIQRSLLPGIDRLKAVSPDSMFIWIPKDIVGGDIFYTYASPEGSIIALMDCTGHGVPGAFLTMIVYSEIRKIILDEAVRTPSEILARLNRAVKSVLHKSADRTDTDDGLDAAVCYIDHSGSRVVYAGARLPLFYVKNGLLHKKAGNKQSLGYKDSDENFQFTDHAIEVVDRCSFYLKTDGFTDQLGGGKKLRFGTRRFSDMVMEHYDKPYGEQRKIFMNTLLDYRGGVEQIDDTTLIGFSLPPLPDEVTVVLNND